MPEISRMDEQEQLLRYATGWLTDEQRQLVEQKLADSPELRTRLELIHEVATAPIGSIAVPPGFSWGAKLAGRRIVLPVLAVLFVVASVLGIAQFAFRSSPVGLGSPQGNALAIVDGASDVTPSNPFVRSVSFVERASSSKPEFEHRSVEVKVRNDFLPCYVEWQVGESKVKEFVPVGDSSYSFESGNVRLEFKPGHSFQWHQAFSVTCNKELLGTSLGPLLWNVGSADEVVVQVCQPIAPWNAVLVWFDTEWIVVTIERPKANFDVDEKLQFVHAGPEEYPNTAWFWAKYGSQGLADELAQFVVVKREEPKMAGRFRGSRHTSISIATFDGLPSEKLRSASYEQLRKVLFDAFETLKTHRPPIGRSIQQEIDLAKELLEQVELLSSRTESKE